MATRSIAVTFRLVGRGSVESKIEPALQPPPFIPPSAKRGADQFVGREWALDEVAGWMDGGTERVLLLVAEPGWGKSSLCAWLIGLGPQPTDAAAKARLERVRADWSAAHLCSATSGSTVNPKTFSRVVASQLAHRYDDFAAAFLQRAAPGEYNVTITAQEILGRAIGIMTDQIIVEADNAWDVYEESVRLPLTDIAARDPDGGPIFILVDGLDDAVTFRQPNIVDLLARSTDLPERVRFLLTSRRETRVLQAFPASSGVRVVQMPDPARREANDDDLRAYVRTRMSEPNVQAWAGRAGLEAEAFVDHLVAQADGNFLFTQFVLDSPPPADGDPRLVPTGLEAAYDEFLARVLPGMSAYGGDPTWEGAVKPVLGALAVAVPAAPEKALPRWLGGKGDVPQALATVGQMTEWIDEDGGARRLYHRSLADFLAAESLPPVAGEPQPNRFFVAPRERHQAIADYYLGAIETEWGGDWSQCDRYGLKRLIAHLHALHAMTEGRAPRAALAERLCDLALDPGFQAAQRSVLGDGSATIESIRLALEASADTGAPAAIRDRIRRVAESWEPEMRADAARALAELGRTDPGNALDELKALVR